MGLFLQNGQNRWKQTHFSTETAHFDQYLNKFLMDLHETFFAKQSKYGVV